MSTTDSSSTATGADAVIAAPSSAEELASDNTRPTATGVGQEAQLNMPEAPQASEKDMEEGRPPAKPEPELDIEHLLVADDPRLWSRKRKMAILWTIAFTAMGGTLSASIYFPAVTDLQKDLNASDSMVSLSVSLFILGQGVFPAWWSGISEIKGRKMCYISALLLYILASAVCSRANSIGLFVGFRVIQALGSSAVLALGGGTLSDIFDTEERGQMLGLFYGLPLLGPALGPLIGGALTTAANWRATFYLIVGYGVICLALAIWLPETFRKERSLAWRKAMKLARAHARADREKARLQLPIDVHQSTPGRTQKTAFADRRDAQPPAAAPATTGMTALGKVLTAMSMRSGEEEVKIKLRDVNPFAAIPEVLSRLYNFLAILYSGLLFASSYAVTFSCSRLFAEPPYNYGALKVGLVLLSFGIGNVVGSVLGGRYSDVVYSRLKARNGGVGEPEMRIRSTRIALFLMPPLLIVFSWVVQKQTPVYWSIMSLFALGLSTIWIYSSTLAYVVDANAGMASSAVATNSLFRGVLAAVASQACKPATDAMGYGWFYTGFALLLIVAQLGLVLVGARGHKWRAASQEKAALKKLEGPTPLKAHQSRLPWRR